MRLIKNWPSRRTHSRSGTLLWALILCPLLPLQPLMAAGLPNQNNGFDLSASTIPVNEIMYGGPPRDGIPALTDPAFTPVKDAVYLNDDDRVIGVDRNGEQKAYPIAILNYHEIVNDAIGGERIAVTYCPLCGTGIVYEALVTGQQLEFGVSGLLYNSDVLLYDRQTESLWSQVLSRAISGPMTNQRLTLIPARHTSWKAWREQHPNTRVLSQDTGHRRDYKRSPYGDYDRSPGVYFPVANSDPRYHTKEIVLTLDHNGMTRAWPFSELARYQQLSGNSLLQDTFGATPLTIEFNLDARSARILDVNNREIPSVQAFWFAWIAFHPNTEVYQAPTGTD
ncbi:DUF3179 domain-containing protein [Aestuariirhabdus sp. LZHN29]|uniref:DUF3179 domain-containing protein n=1 Tax=Aestuariirhabdus sp. LZHN29 TaxID=3417462 RepID=UPI003CEBCB04